jgi:hypothetical protein
MPARKRKRRERTHDWQEIQQYTLFPEQEVYERLRPIVLFGETAAERAKETGASPRTLHYQARLFEQEGMANLFPKERSEPPAPGRNLPPEMCQLIVNLKAEYPGFSLREISTICFLQFGRHLSHHTVQRVLADGPQPTVTTRRYPPYAQIADPSQRRRALSICTPKAGHILPLVPTCKRLAITCMKCSSDGQKKATLDWMIDLRRRTVPRAKLVFGRSMRWANW